MVKDLSSTRPASVRLPQHKDCRSTCRSRSQQCGSGLGPSAGLKVDRLDRQCRLSWDITLAMLPEGLRGGQGNAKVEQPPLPGCMHKPFCNAANPCQKNREERRHTSPDLCLRLCRASGAQIKSISGLQRKRSWEGSVFDGPPPLLQLTSQLRGITMLVTSSCTWLNQLPLQFQAQTAALSLRSRHGSPRLSQVSGSEESQMARCKI